MISETILAFGTLFPIVNPVSTSFVFSQMAKGISKRDRRLLATTACLTAFCVLVAFLYVGSYILSFFNITIYAFKFAGGLYLGKVGFEMLSKNLRKDPEHYEDVKKEMAIIPLAIPLLSGPGAITSVLVMSEEFATISIILAITAICIISWILLNVSTVINKVFGRTGTNVVERILGLIVLVISVQFVFNGITGYLLAIGFV